MLGAVVLDELRAAVGEDGVSTDPADRDAVAHDLWPRALIRERGGERLAGPDAVVWPRTRAQVEAVCAACHRAGVPLTPFGAGTGVCGAAIPVRGGVVLDLKRLDRILDWDLESGWVTVEPGSSAAGSRTPAGSAASPPATTPRRSRSRRSAASSPPARRAS